MEAEILQLKADIYNLKDVFRKYSMYGKFLAAISPEDWRKEQEALAAQTVTTIPPNIQVKINGEKTRLMRILPRSAVLCMVLCLTSHDWFSRI